MRSGWTHAEFYRRQLGEIIAPTEMEAFHQRGGGQVRSNSLLIGKWRCDARFLLQFSNRKEGEREREEREGGEREGGEGREQMAERVACRSQS